MPRKRRTVPNPFEVLFNPAQQEQEYDEDDDFNERVRQARVQRKLIRQQLRDGELEDQEVEIEVEDTTAPRVEFFDGVGMQEMEINMQDIFGGLLPKRTRKRRVSVGEARRILAQEEAAKLVDQDAIVAEAIRRCEKQGIVFLDELDKIAGRESGVGPDVSGRSSEGPVAYSRRHHGDNQVWPCKDGPHIVHRCRCVSCDQAFGPDS